MRNKLFVLILVLILLNGNVIYAEIDGTTSETKYGEGIDSIKKEIKYFFVEFEEGGFAGTESQLRDKIRKYEGIKSTRPKSTTLVLKQQEINAKIDAYIKSYDPVEIPLKQYQIAESQWIKGGSFKRKGDSLVITRPDKIKVTTNKEGKSTAKSSKGTNLPGNNPILWKEKDGKLTYEGKDVTTNGKVITYPDKSTLQFTNKNTQIKTNKFGRVSVTFADGSKAPTMGAQEYELISKGDKSIDDYASVFEKGKSTLFLGLDKDDNPIFKKGRQYYRGTEKLEKTPGIAIKYSKLGNLDIIVTSNPETGEEILFSINGNIIDAIIYEEIKNAKGKGYDVKSEGAQTVITQKDKNGNVIKRIDLKTNKPKEGEPLLFEKKITEYTYLRENSKDKNSKIVKLPAKIWNIQGETILAKTDSEFFYDEEGNLFSESYVYVYDEKSKQLKYKQFSYSKDGKVYFYDADKKAWNEEPPKEAKSARTSANMRRWVRDFEWSVNTFKGLGFYSRIFMTDEDLRSWRDNVDNAFCSTILLGGTDCWTSKICGHTYDKSTREIAYVETPSGMIEAGAHLEVEKSSEITNPETGLTEYLYKITFYVKAHKSNLKFNVELDGDKTTKLFSKDILLEGDEGYDEEITSSSFDTTKATPSVQISEGKEYSALGENAIVQYSTFNYDKVCIKFSEGDLEDLCNRIAESDYSKDNFIASKPTVLTTGDTIKKGESSINQI